jgi:hypothetical protein
VSNVPANVTFANATELFDSNGVIDAHGFTTGATKEPGEPDNPNAADSVWFKWTPQHSGRLRYTMSDMDGSIPDLWFFEAHGDSFQDLKFLTTGAERPYVFAGNTYYFALYSHPDQLGLYRFGIETAFSPPANDNFSQAIDLSTTNPIVTVTVNGTTFGATREVNEPYNPAGNNSVWYKWTPTFSGQAIARLLSWGDDLTVFESRGNSFDGLVKVAGNSGVLSFNTGVTYYIAVYNSSMDSAAFQFQLSPPPRPSNDDMNQGSFLAGYDVNITGLTTAGSTIEPGEPNPDGATGSIWFGTYPLANTHLSWSIPAGSAHVSLYIGNSMESLRPVDSNDLYAGCMYFLRVSTTGDFTGPFELDLKYSALPASAPNDNFASSAPLESLNSMSQGFVLGAATSESGEPEHISGPSKSLWWQWRAPEPGGVLEIVAGSSGSQNVTLAVYDGDKLENLQLIAKAAGSLSAPVAAGETIFIAAAAPLDFDGNVTLTTWLSPGEIDRLEQAIQFPPIPDVSNQSDLMPLNATSDSGLPVSYIVESGPAIINGNSVQIIGVGTISIRAKQRGNEVYKPAADVVRAFTVNGKPQTITFETVDVSAPVIQLRAQSSSGLPVRFAVISGPAVLDRNVITNAGFGPITIRASQPGNREYEAADPVDQTFVMKRLEQNIEIIANLPQGGLGETNTFPELAAHQKRSRAAAIDAFELTAEASSALPVDLTVVSGPGKFENGFLTITGTGLILVRATQAGDSIFEPTSVEKTFAGAVQASQTIDFALPGKLTFGDGPIRLEALASSGLPVSFEVVSGKGTIAGDMLTLNGAGQITIRASQPGNENFEAAPAVERTIDIARAFQMIDFSPLAQLRFGSSPVALRGSASSGLPVRFDVASGPAVIEGGSLRTTGAGAIVLKVSQPGNEDYLPAASIYDGYTIAKGSQTIQFDLPATIQLGGPSIPLSALATSQLPIAFSVISGPGDIKAQALTATAAGDIVIEARQDGDENYEAAAPVQKTITVLGSPLISATVTDGKLVLNWPAEYTEFKLESAASIQGPWIEASDEEPAKAVDTSGPSRFFRLRRAASSAGQ